MFAPHFLLHSYSVDSADSDLCILWNPWNLRNQIRFCRILLGFEGVLGLTNISLGKQISTLIIRKNLALFKANLVLVKDVG
jgi:hypothetical protein